MLASGNLGEDLATVLTSRFRIALEPAGRSSVRVSDIRAPNGFAIGIVKSWRRIEARFEPDSYAGHLIRSMGAAGGEAKASYTRLLDGFFSLSIRVEMAVNGRALDNPKLLPPHPWNSLELTVSRLTASQGEEASNEAVELASACLALVICLLPIDEDGPSNEQFAGVPEGAKTTVVVNRYERSSVNRAACIARYGTRCQACGFEFELQYGPIGAGFIEVHHVVPVSKIGPGYVIDPFMDLIPLCSNCHSIAHRIDPPLTVDDLRKLLEKSQEPSSLT